jgi:hypothetical protein
VLADTSSSRPCPWGLGGLGGLDPEKNGWANLANALVALLAYLWPCWRGRGGGGGGGRGGSVGGAAVLMGCTRFRGVSIILKGPQLEVEQPEPLAQEGSSITWMVS